MRIGKGGKTGTDMNNMDLAHRVQFRSVSEIEFCTLYVCSRTMDLGLHIRVHARKKSFLRHCPSVPLTSGRHRRRTDP
jgi:hypothetical protein